MKVGNRLGIVLTVRRRLIMIRLASLRCLITSIEE